ncbi:hypothetical protein PCL_09525 [Purpureocillium lilacinum]|uniref:Uncharacterized protein n=1 Tax=Purpureocillium lilacinum TaxID=33203 RepID=A0A2U3DQT7_PURLI|nr:hypothetical protein PCL_09525 [Purpureocillium lilacinum]
MPGQVSAAIRVDNRRHRLMTANSVGAAYARSVGRAVGERRSGETVVKGRTQEDGTRSRGRGVVVVGVVRCEGRQATTEARRGRYGSGDGGTRLTVFDDGTAGWSWSRRRRSGPVHEETTHRDDTEQAVSTREATNSSQGDGRQARARQKGGESWRVVGRAGKHEGQASRRRDTAGGESSVATGKVRVGQKQGRAVEDVVGCVPQTSDKHGLTAVSHVQKGVTTEKQNEGTFSVGGRASPRVWRCVSVVLSRWWRTQGRWCGSREVQQAFSSTGAHGTGRSTGSEVQAQEVARGHRKEEPRTVGAVLRARVVAVVAVVGTRRRRAIRAAIARGFDFVCVLLSEIHLHTAKCTQKPPPGRHTPAQRAEQRAHRSDRPVPTSRRQAPVWPGPPRPPTSRPSATRLKPRFQSGSSAIALPGAAPVPVGASQCPVSVVGAPALKRDKRRPSRAGRIIDFGSGR